MALREPQKMELDYDTNPGTNYIASKMSETAMEKIKNSVAEEVTKTYVETVFDQIVTVGDGMQEAADGSWDANAAHERLTSEPITAKSGTLPGMSHTSFTILLHLPQTASSALSSLAADDADTSLTVYVTTAQTGIDPEEQNPTEDSLVSEPAALPAPAADALPVVTQTDASEPAQSDDAAEANNAAQQTPDTEDAT